MTSALQHLVEYIALLSSFLFMPDENYALVLTLDAIHSHTDFQEHEGINP